MTMNTGIAVITMSMNMVTAIAAIITATKDNCNAPISWFQNLAYGGNIMFIPRIVGEWSDGNS